MAQSYTSSNGTLYIPGAYPSLTVQQTMGGLSANGIIALVGEADQGPDFSLETNLAANLFGPDAGSAVVAKYKSGNLVDAFNAAVTAANDPQLIGAPSRILLVKTNASTRASGPLTKGAGVYGTLSDLSYGKYGNLITYNTVAKTAETLPTVTLVSAVPLGAFTASVRVNGGAKVTTGSISTGATPTTIASTLNALSGISCTGGADILLAPTTGTITATASGSTLTITCSANSGVIPVTTALAAGQMIYIPTTSVIKGAVAGSSYANAGSYVVTSATTTTIVMTKIKNGTGAAVGDALAAPATVSGAALSGTAANDIIGYTPIVLTLSSATIIDGVGKSLEFIEPTSNTGEALAKLLWTTGGSAYVQANDSTRVGVLSTAAAPYTVVSGQELSITLNVNRAVDNISESISAGGQVALQLAYKGTTATVTITATTLTTSVTGGSGSNLNLTLSDYATIADLVAAINLSTNVGYTAKVGSATIGSYSPLGLDEVTAAGICTENNQGSTTSAYLNGRIKVDASKFWAAVASGSSTVRLNSDPVPNPKGQVGKPSALGLPDVASDQGLTGGSKGGTTAAKVVAAIDALKGATCNFIVPLFSQDATTDIASSLTESSSTYTVDAINAYVKTHVNAMSTLKAKKNRQGFLSKRDTFANAKAASANIGAYRCQMTFQDVKRVSTAGVITQYQPWMGAVIAAGMQATGIYKGIFRKGVNCSGILQAAGDFNDQLDSDMEDALIAGLLPLKTSTEGGFYFASDQTTYGKDNNFVYNSIQAVYVADLLALSTALRMERMFVGQSTADISASLALTALESMMDDFRRLKFITASDDAPRGYKNAKIQISGTAMIVSIECKLAGCIYFIPISMYISQVTQTA